MRYDVICPFCGGVYFETTDNFNEPAKGNMFVPKQEIVDAGWTTFPLYETTEYNNLVCPSCGQPLVDTAGRLVKKVAKKNIALEELEKEWSEYSPSLPNKKNQYTEESPNNQKVPCPVCGEPYGRSGLHFHLRAKHPDYEG